MSAWMNGAAAYKANGDKVLDVDPLLFSLKVDGYPCMGLIRSLFGLKHGRTTYPKIIKEELSNSLLPEKMLSDLRDGSHRGHWCDTWFAFEKSDIDALNKKILYTVSYNGDEPRLETLEDIVGAGDGIWNLLEEIKKLEAEYVVFWINP